MSSNRFSYPSDLSEAQWLLLEPLIPVPKSYGRPREYDLRAIVNAIFYVLRSGCSWRMPPHDFPPWSTVFAGHHPPLRTWVLCLYFMGLNLSNRQIASELGLNKDDVQRMTKQLRQGIECAQPDPQLSGEVEANEVYVTAGHKGRPEAVQKKASRPASASQGREGPRHLRQGEAADSGADPAQRRADVVDAGERATTDHPADHPQLRPRGHSALHR